MSVSSRNAAGWSRRSPLIRRATRTDGQSAFVRELRSGFATTRAAALKTGDGAPGDVLGQSVRAELARPDDLRSRVQEGRENKKYARQLRSSAGVAVSSPTGGPEAGWQVAGVSRSLCRRPFLGIRHAHLNMPIEAIEVRPGFGRVAGHSGTSSDLVVRFGRARAHAHSNPPAVGRGDRATMRYASTRCLRVSVT